MYDYEIARPDPKDVEVTATHYRVRIPVAAGKTRTFPVVLENTTWQSWHIDGMATDQLLAYASSRGNLDPETRSTFQALADIRRAMDAIDQQIYALDNQRQEIFNDQQRVRENLKSLTDKSAVKEKYLDKLNEQEDEIAKLDEEKQKLVKKRGEKEKELKEKISGVKF
jgi:chromosome segregation ATPase